MQVGLKNPMDKFWCKQEECKTTVLTYIGKELFMFISNRETLFIDVVKLVFKLNFYFQISLDLTSSK